MTAPFLLRCVSWMAAGAFGAASAASPFVPPAPRSTSVWGLTWSPEAFFEVFAKCGDHCEGPPGLVQGTPGWEASKLAAVDVEAHAGPLGVVAGKGQSTEDGAWHIDALPSDVQAPYYFVAQPSDTDSPYVRTFISRPLDPTFSLCAMVPAPLLRKDGIAAAVTRFLHAGAGASAVSVVAAFQPGLRLQLAPASGISLRAPSGYRVLAIGYKPGTKKAPGTFFVQGEGRPSQTGLFAVVFPAKGPGQVALTVQDRSRDPQAARPWHGTLQLVRPPPGTLGFAPFHVEMAQGELPYVAPEPMMCSSAPGQP